MMQKGMMGLKRFRFLEGHFKTRKKISLEKSYQVTALKW